MRVAAVAFVLVVGAAVVLAFANTLNSWVLGGLLGGLAAILLSIPISLTLFTLLARRQEAHQQGGEPEFAYEPDYAGEDIYDERVVYEAEGYALPMEEDAYPDARLYPGRNSRRPVSGYLPLPPTGREEYDDEEDGMEASTRRDPRNYPRQPRASARPPAADGESRQSTRSYRNPSTYSLAQHQAQARRQARHEARQRSTNRSSGQPPHRTHTPPALRSRASGRPPASASRRLPDSYDTRVTGRPAWSEEEDTEDFLAGRARVQRMQQRRDYRPNPRASRTGDRWTTGMLEDGRTDAPERRRPPDPERRSGSLQNPLVRRAPYLYEDDPLREEFAQQLRQEPPTTRRSSRYQAYEEEEY